MKNLIAIVLILITTTAFAQTSEADQIIGTYMSEGNKGKIVISKQDDEYIGTLVWTDKSDAVDKNNPDKSKRNNKVAGTVILKGLIYTGNNTWDKASIYDPESGNTYKCTLTRKQNGNLSLRGYVGVSLFGRTMIWTKTN